MESASYDAGPGILGLTWAATGVATLIMLLRLIAKHRIRNLSWDDATMVFAYALAIASSILITIAISHGYGRHGYELDRTDRILTTKLYTVFQCVTIVSTGTGRVAFVLYLMPIFRHKYLTGHLLWLIFALQLIANYVSPVTILARCSDIRAIWDVSVKSKCWNPNILIIYSYVQCTINTATDLYLAIFPAYTLWSLNLKRRTKTILIILMSLGLIAMVGSIMRIINLPSLSIIDDESAATNRLTIWALLECYLVITTASIPCIRTLVLDSVRLLVNSSRSRSHREADSRRTMQNTWGDYHISRSHRVAVGDDVEDRRHILGDVELGRYSHTGISKLVEVTVAEESIPKWI
ncbi:uncharacterized protein AKAW2_70091A [Aspergillus luchuensis]|uniref:Uncharacterized protein n=1 Tax=Aspergillus kawachii TaxID=1069201 RepID=A0A7R7WHS5_ASPKA|nr:uncharacterized protein AKAW2_70091A [Aspergillus luchuensis]BCS03213.1 hypothetical protein AKAW2_70091A [Aspergillus luchuensis]BCS14847.1 hypothetical protein ALUC_70080A [Aspergillus luchuensis]